MRAELLAIAGNRILAVGSNADMKALKGSHTRVIDAQMNTVMPGIVESHIHLFGGAVELDSLMINNIKGFPAVSAAIREYAAANPKDRIIIVNGAAPVSLGDTTAITRQVLDSIIADRPLALICFDHHTVWANTRALEAGGLLHGASLTPGNEIVMGSDGLATGELREAAAFAPLLNLTATGGREWLGMVTGENPVPPATAAERLIDQNFMKRGLEYCASLGITSIHNMDGNWYQLELLKALMDKDELIARVEVPFHQKNFFETSRVDEAVEMRAQYQGDMLHSGRVKIFMDGVLESMTALMLDDYPGFQGERGAPLFTAAQFNEVATRADKHGLQISVHAIGDGGVRRTLDGYEAARKANGPRDSRHRIEHIELIDKADIPRLKQLGVIASLQPIVGPGRSRQSAGTLPHTHRRQAAASLRLANPARNRRNRCLLVRLARVAARSLPRHSIRHDLASPVARKQAASPVPDGCARWLHRRRRLHGICRGQERQADARHAGRRHRSQRQYRSNARSPDVDAETRAHHLRWPGDV